MDSIRIENLRNLADTGFIELKPITLLLGRNSSGKSTFLRTFPLLRQSVESGTTGPILWYGRFVDFGSFQEALNKNAKEQEIAFHFQFHVASESWAPFRLHGLSLLEDLDIVVTLKIARGTRSNYTKECVLTFAGHFIRIVFDKGGKVTEFFVNSRDLSEIGSRFQGVQGYQGMPDTLLIPYLSGWNREMHSRGSSFLGSLLSEIQKQVHKNTSRKTISNLAMSFGFGSSDKMLQAMQNSNPATAFWKKQASRWTTDSRDFQLIRDLLLAHKVIKMLPLIDEHIATFARNSNYIEPLRTTAERYYRLQNLAIDEVDSQGQNLAMFLSNLSSSARKRFSEWTEQYFDFATQVHKGGGHISIRMKESGSVKEFNLADMGFGFSQILPILTQLWVLVYHRHREYISRLGLVPTTFAVEQPELHLHPSLQARLADAFLDAIKAAKNLGIELKLIIETHSETMVNRFGHRVANQDIAPEEINIVLFERKGPNVSAQVRVGEYDRDGFLTNWPFGFFEPDEV